MARNIEPPVSTPEPRGGTRETHPAFGVAVLTRSSGTGVALFQSDLLHRHTLTLRISHAERHRDLHHDWTFGREEIVEIQMSEAQWGELVSSVGIGSGVPVTIRHTERDGIIPDLPHQPRLASSVAEARAAVADLLAKAQDSLADLRAAIDGKQGVKATREALDRHASVLRNAESNAAFAVKSVSEATERVVSQAKADIEIQVLRASQIAGIDARGIAPELTSTTMPEIEP